jgi:hypothetical protein
MQNKFLITFLLISSFFIKIYSQDLVVKTNIPYLLTTTPNIGVEYAFTKNLSFELTTGINPFEFRESQLKHWVIWPELRYWSYEPFNGHFIGLHSLHGKFNVGGWDLGISKLEPLKERLYKGNVLGAGLSYGYHWILDNRWGLEFTMGLGVAKVTYGVHNFGGSQMKIGEGNKYYIGPTKGAISVTYTIW